MDSETRQLIEDVVQSIRETSELLRKLGRRSTMFTALIGECLVFSELLNRGFDAVWKSKYGFGHCDISVANKRIEVKAATYNQEYGIWGFGNISPEKFDYLVCVALDDDLNNPRYFIFTKKEASYLPTEAEAHRGRTKRFSKGRKLTFHLFRKEDQKHQPSEKLRAINEGIARFQNCWDKIRQNAACSSGELRQ